MCFYDSISEKTANWIAKGTKTKKDSNEYLKMKYSLAAIYINFFKISLILILAFLLRLVPQVVVSMLSYTALRLFAHGLHFQRTYICTLEGVIRYLGGSYLVLQVHIPIVMRTVLLALCLAAFIRYAPAGTEDRPIFENEKPRFKRNALVSLSCIAMLSLGISFIPGLEWISNCLTFSAVCASVYILPITYKILQQNNGGIQNEN